MPAGAPVWFSTVMLAAYMAAVVYLVEQFGPPIDHLLETLQAPAPRRSTRASRPGAQ
jgi:hypothetical protein